MEAPALSASSLHSLDIALNTEWLETNGLGGYASSTVSGAHSRRYHGLLVAAVTPPVERRVMLSRLDETIVLNSHSYELSTAVFDGAVHPQGYQYQSSFSRDLFPTWEFALPGIRLRKTIGMLHGQNTVVIRYDCLEAPAPLILRLRPLVAARDYHSLTHCNGSMDTEPTWSDGALLLRTYPGMPLLSLRLPGGAFTKQPDWYYAYQLLTERARGFDATEDLFTPGTVEAPLLPLETAALAREESRRKALLEQTTVKDYLGRALTLAADQFLVRRGTDGLTIIAGYPWFTDWGRDTMIALPGLTLVTRRWDEGRRILQTFLESISEGMIPNLFPDGNQPPLYNTVDATLWLFVALYQYWKHTGDNSLLNPTTVAKLTEILELHNRGTRFGIHADSDGLLCAGDHTVQLTWMDAKIGDWVVTPRSGKAVEIQALWYNAHCILAEFLTNVGAGTDAANYQGRAAEVKRAFTRLFWSAEHSHYFDVVEGDHRDASLRPNQIFALSLPYPIATASHAELVLTKIKDELYTPMGLRTLSPNHPSYQGRYTGGPRQRDGAYHQGTAWAWLLGPYVSALLKFGGTQGRKEAVAVIENFKPHLLQGCIGSISEIFDGDPPHTPRGACAQAWSVAELLRAHTEIQQSRNSRASAQGGITQ
ncbi:MAG: glycogen debranching protein, partial [Proteobacteria bacterium]|nr:glycogen debranching protein [Pseudomonadota bacterium]